MKAKKAIKQEVEVAGVDRIEEAELCEVSFEDNSAQEGKTLGELYQDFFEAYKVFEQANDAVGKLHEERNSYAQNWGARYAPIYQDFEEKQKIVDDLKKKIEFLETSSS